MNRKEKRDLRQLPDGTSPNYQGMQTDPKAPEVYLNTALLVL